MHGREELSTVMQLNTCHSQSKALTHYLSFTPQLSLLTIIAKIFCSISSVFGAPDPSLPLPKKKKVNQYWQPHKILHLQWFSSNSLFDLVEYTFIPASPVPTSRWPKIPAATDFGPTPPIIMSSSLAHSTAPLSTQSIPDMIFLSHLCTLASLVTIRIEMAGAKYVPAKAYHPMSETPEYLCVHSSPSAPPRAR